MPKTKRNSSFLDRKFGTGNNSVFSVFNHENEVSKKENPCNEYVLSHKTEEYTNKQLINLTEDIELYNAIRSVHYICNKIQKEYNEMFLEIIDIISEPDFIKDVPDTEHESVPDIEHESVPDIEHESVPDTEHESVHKENNKIRSPSPDCDLTPKRRRFE